MIPKCTSWLGHKFEARYSYNWPDGRYEATLSGAPRDVEVMVRAQQDKTYERDICVRCGHVIERKP